MKLKASEIFESFHARGLIDEMAGPDAEFTDFAPVENGTSSSLVFVDNADFVDQAVHVGRL